MKATSVIFKLTIKATCFSTGLILLLILIKKTQGLGLLVLAIVIVTIALVLSTRKSRHPQKTKHESNTGKLPF